MLLRKRILNLDKSNEIFVFELRILRILRYYNDMKTQEVTQFGFKIWKVKYALNHFLPLWFKSYMKT